MLKKYNNNNAARVAGPYLIAIAIFFLGFISGKFSNLLWYNKPTNVGQQSVVAETSLPKVVQQTRSHEVRNVDQARQQEEREKRNPLPEPEPPKLHPALVGKENIPYSQEVKKIIGSPKQARTVLLKMFEGVKRSQTGYASMGIPVTQYCTVYLSIQEKGESLEVAGSRIEDLGSQSRGNLPRPWPQGRSVQAVIAGDFLEGKIQYINMRTEDSIVSDPKAVLAEIASLAHTFELAKLPAK